MLCFREKESSTHVAASTNTIRIVCHWVCGLVQYLRQFLAPSSCTKCPKTVQRFSRILTCFSYVFLFLQPPPPSPVTASISHIMCLGVVMQIMSATVCLCALIASISRKVIPPTPYPPYKYRGGGVHWNHFVRPSVRPSVCLSFCPCFRFCPDDISCTAEPFLTKLAMVMYYHECHAQSVVLYQNIIISTISSKVLARLQPNLV